MRFIERSVRVRLAQLRQLKAGKEAVGMAGSKARENVLGPQVSIPASEAWLYRNPKALSAVRRGLEEAADGKAVSIGAFTKYADAE